MNKHNKTETDSYMQETNSSCQKGGGKGIFKKF